MNALRSIPESKKILIIASEIYPFAKVGGLGDVVGALSAALCKNGHDVRIVLPRYAVINPVALQCSTRLASMGVWMGDAEEWCSVFETMAPGGVPCYFIEHQHYFGGRSGLYHDAAMSDYNDNPRRFGFFSRAALQLCKDIDFKPDIIHTHDWQTALAAAYLKLWHWNDRQLGGTASVLTIHNAAYQGVYPKEHLNYLGLGWHNFTADKFESYDKINFLKGGIYYADCIATVSPSFAREITTPFGGFGLAPYLVNRGEHFRGILNGIDDQTWNPATDTLLPANFSTENPEGKKMCKSALQEMFDLEPLEHCVLIGTIGRFVEQKGFELLASAIEKILGSMTVQFVILGTGEQHLEFFFRNLPSRYSGRVGSYIGFDNNRAHLIEAGCDFFLMPSLFEPCGLNQMYSQRYGTLPIVRATGGLDDTVEQYNEATGTGTGFKFWDVSRDALYYTIGWAVSTYYDRPHHCAAMMRQAMQQDFSWHKRSADYESLYDLAMKNKKEHDENSKSYYW